MTREKALRMVETIMSSNMEVHGAKLDERGRQAMGSAVADLQGLVNEIYDDQEVTT